MEAEQRQPPPLVADLVRDTIGDEQIERIRQGVATRRQQPPRTEWQHRLAPLTAAAAILIAAAITIWIWSDGETNHDMAAHEPGPIRVVGGDVLKRIVADRTMDEAHHIDLSDGSSVELSPGTTLVATVNTARFVRLILAPGRATFKVVPGGPRRWLVDAGIASVEVVGTEFTLERRERQVEVLVSRGRVRIRSHEGTQELTAGQFFVVEGSEYPDPVKLPAPADAGVPRVAAGSPQWQRLAGDGDYGQAYELLGAEGLQCETDRAATLERLMTLADVARLSGHPQEAVAPLERILDEFSSEPRASVAAFTLGRLESDVLRRHDRAAIAFQRCLDLRPPRALSEDAYSRLAEAHARKGDFEAARQAAGEYLRRYPEGHHAEKLRRWVGPR